MDSFSFSPSKNHECILLINFNENSDIVNLPIENFRVEAYKKIRKEIVKGVWRLKYNFKVRKPFSEHPC